MLKVYGFRKDSVQGAGTGIGIPDKHRSHEMITG